MDSIHETQQNSQLLSAYDAAELKMVPLRPDTKRPYELEWQHKPYALEDIEQRAANGDSVGLQAGEVSGWLSFVDNDCDEARALAPHFLPETLASGKELEAVPSHYAYIAEGSGFMRVSDLKNKPLVEIKASADGAGHQCAVEPSVHATKGRYVWLGGFNPSRITRISAEDLERRVRMLGTAALIARHFPPVGGRHDYRMMVAGLLLRNGETPEDVRAIMRPALEYAGADRDGLRDLENVIADTVEALEADKKVKGGGQLQKAVPGLPAKIGDALGWERTNMSEGSYKLTDDGNALRFVDRYGELVRYCPPWKAWLVWDGQRWVKGAEGKIMRLAREVSRTIHKDAANYADTEVQKLINKWAITSQHRNRIQAMVELARYDERVEVEPDVFDADPWLLTVENGTLDLRTGELHDSRPEDHITKLAPVGYDANAPAPRFEQFLAEVFAGDEELIGFVGRFAGYTLTGSTQERVLAMLHGAGRNGKSTLVELLRHVMGDYAKGTDVETVLAKKYQGVGNDVAALKGARFVSTSEIERGRHLAESKVKQLTGSDTVTARFLFSEPFDFKPEFKLWISTNNKPEIHGTDNAIWDRIRLIPFGVRFEGESVDPKLPEKLRDEAAGVLAWMVRGCLEWQVRGLDAPEAVTAATDEYRAEMDTFSEFFSDECVEGQGLAVLVGDLSEAYDKWCFRNDADTLNKRDFNKEMKARGFKQKQVSSGTNKGRKVWAGVDLRSNDPEPDPTLATSSGRVATPATAKSRIGKPKSPYEGSGVAGVASESETFDHTQPRVRKDLDRPATPATRYSGRSNPGGRYETFSTELQEYYWRLREEGKHHADALRLTAEREEGEDATS